MTRRKNANKMPPTFTVNLKTADRPYLDFLDRVAAKFGYRGNRSQAQRKVWEVAMEREAEWFGVIS